MVLSVHGDGTKFLGGEETAAAGDLGDGERGRVTKTPFILTKGRSSAEKRHG